MNALTKEQIEELEHNAKEFDAVRVVSKTQLEILRGYRAYLQACEHHYAELAEATAEQDHNEIGFDAVVNYHRARIDALESQPKDAE